MPRLGNRKKSLKVLSKLIGQVSFCPTFDKNKVRLFLTKKQISCEIPKGNGGNVVYVSYIA